MYRVLQLSGFQPFRTKSQWVNFNILRIKGKLKGTRGNLKEIRDISLWKRMKNTRGHRKITGNRCFSWDKIQGEW